MPMHFLPESSSKATLGDPVLACLAQSWESVCRQPPGPWSYLLPAHPSVHSSFYEGSDLDGQTGRILK